jgi:methylated-DNA-[protein]-cysteine S-methyltransferase
MAGGRTQMLAYRSISSPLGELFLAATEQGLCRVAWTVSESAFAAELEATCPRSGQEPSPGERVEPGALDTTVACSRTSLLQEAAQQLGEYFEGRRREFALPLDLSCLRLFQRRVLTALLQVPYGEVVTYGGLAVLSGHPGAARAVGGAMRGNPLPIIIPCHRVLPSSGGLGGFGGRPDLKQYLLELEGWGDVSASAAPRRKKPFA